MSESEHKYNTLNRKQEFKLHSLLLEHRDEISGKLTLEQTIEFITPLAGFSISPHNLIGINQDGGLRIN